MRLVLAQLDVLFFGLLYVTRALLSLFACVAHLFVANRPASQNGKNHRIMKRRMYLNCLKNPTSHLVSAAVRSVLVARSSAAEPEEGISSCAGIHLVWLCVSQLCLALAQCCAVFTVFFKKMSVFHGQRRQARGIETAVAAGVSGATFLKCTDEVCTGNRKTNERRDTPRFAFRTRGLYLHLKVRAAHPQKPCGARGCDSPSIASWSVVWKSVLYLSGR